MIRIYRYDLVMIWLYVDVPIPTYTRIRMAVRLQDFHIFAKSSQNHHQNSQITMGGRKALSTNRFSGRRKPDTTKKYPYVTYISVKEYPSIQRNVEIRWLDTFKFASTMLPAALLYDRIVPKFCEIKGIPEQSLRILAAAVLNEILNGDRYFTLKTILPYIPNIQRNHQRESLFFLTHYSYLIKMPRNQGTNLDRFFMTALGQGLLNEFYGYCVKANEDIRGYLSSL